MSDEAGSVSVTILGDLKPFEDALREVERRAEAAVKRIEAITGKIRFSPAGGGSAVSGIAELDAAAKKAEDIHRSLTRNLVRAGNEQAAETRKALREQERAVEESARKQAHIRAVLARDFKRATNEQIDDARRLAREMDAAQKPINASRAQSSANAGQAKWNAWAGISSGGSGDAQRSANVYKAIFAEEDAARRKAVSDARAVNAEKIAADRAAASERAKIDRALAASVKTAVNEEVAAQKRAASEKKAIYDKEVADRKRLAAAMLQDAKEQAAINRRAAIEETAIKRGGMKADQNRRFLASQASYQVSDIVSGLAMGQSPMMIATQQGGQIYDLFQRGGGVKPTLDAFGSALKFAINPIFLATGAIAGLGLIAGTAAYKFDKMMRELNNSTQLSGRSSGATASSLYGIASRQTELSTSSAADTVGIFASSGVNVGIIAEMTDRVKKFAYATGQDATDAARELAAALSDPAKGVDDLAKRMGGFDAVVVQNIKNLAAQGDRFGAQKALSDAFSAALDKANIEINKAAAGWSRIGKAVSDIYNATGKSVSAAIFGEEDEDKLKRINSEIDEIRSTIGRLNSSSMYSPAYKKDLGERLSALEKEKDALDSIRKSREEAAKDSAREADIQSKSIGVQKSGYDVLGLGPKQDLDNAAQSYFKLIVAAGSVEAAARAAGMSTEEFNQATFRTQKAADAAVSADEKIVDQHKAAIEMIKARTVEEKILAAQMSIRANAKNTTENTAENERFVAEQARATLKRHADDLLRSANDNASSAGMSGLSKTTKDIETKYAREIELAGNDAAAIEKLIAAREKEKATAATNATAGPIRDATFAINEQIAATRIQASTFGEGAGAVAEATERQKLYNQYAREGVKITPELAAGIEGIAKAAGHAAREQDELTKSQKRIIEEADHIRDAGGSFLKTFINDLAKGKSGVDALKDALNSLLQKLLDRVEDNLIDQIFGKKGTVAGGADDKSLLGSVMGSIFGKNKEKSAPLSILPGGGDVKPSLVPSVGDVSYLKQIYTGRSGGIEGLNTDFASRLSKFAKDNPGVTIKSAFRSEERQKELWDAALEKYGSADEARKWVAPPGHSQHNMGKAADLGYASDAVREKAMASAGNYGLKFPLSNENWHIESASARTSLDPTKLNGASEALSKLQTNAIDSAANLGDLGTSTTQVTSALTGVGTQAGGGFGGLLGGLFSLFKFEDGGIMTSSGPMPLRKYADGGIASSPQLAMFGEGSGPEAYVPLKNGGIPVRISGPKSVGASNFAQTNINIGGSSITVEGNADQKTLDIMRDELDARDRRISRDLDRNFGVHQRAYSALRSK